MGLLADLPDDFLNLIRNAAQSRNPKIDFGADDANDLPSWVPQGQQQRPPLSLAGPGLTADVPVSSPSRGVSADSLRATVGTSDAKPDRTSVADERCA
jgi:hypothetical protein